MLRARTPDAFARRLIRFEVAVEQWYQHEQDFVRRMTADIDRLTSLAGLPFDDLPAENV
jgi:hypothetical protein